MTIESWLLYLILVLAATATPGPAILFIISSSTLYGWKKASYAALGNITGLVLLGIVAITGLGTLLETSVTVFNIIKYAGAAYLVYLGLKLIFKKHSTLPSIKETISPAEISS
ncbi:MAG: LysE family translocator, partial [Desulfocapsa sp.]|nr:LysE family translocator [Desulfocapsa sp.]